MEENGSVDDGDDCQPNDNFATMNSHMTEEWFHGKMDRDIAKQRLIESARNLENSDGLFLVRESNTFVGDFTLSFLYHGLFQALVCMKMHHPIFGYLYKTIIRNFFEKIIKGLKNK
jgi:hypothetical protein